MAYAWGGRDDPSQKPNVGPIGLVTPRHGHYGAVLAYRQIALARAVEQAHQKASAPAGIENFVPVGGDATRVDDLVGELGNVNGDDCLGILDGLGQRQVDLTHVAA